MKVKRKIKILIVITTNLLLISCAHNQEVFDIVIPEKDKTVDNFNPTTSRPTTVEEDLINKNTTVGKHDRQKL